MGALLRVCATWVAEIVGRMGIAFELIEWAAGEDLRCLNDGDSSFFGLVGCANAGLLRVCAFGA